MPAYEANTKELLDIYGEVWLKQWVNEGHFLDCSIVPGVKRFMFSKLKQIEKVQANKESVYGTVEFIPYDGDSQINEDFPFYSYSFLHGKTVYEIEKLAIRKEQQGSIRLLLEIFFFITAYAMEKEVDYLIGLIKPQLYEVMVERFKINVTRLDSSTEKGYVPFLIETEKVRRSEFGEKVLKKYGMKEKAMRGI